MPDFVEYEPIGIDPVKSFSSYAKKYNIEPFSNPFYKKLMDQSDTGFVETVSDIPETPPKKNAKEKLNFVEITEKVNNKKEESKLPEAPDWMKKDFEDLGLDDEEKKYLIQLAKVESNFDPHVTNKSGYYGLYQFGDSALSWVGQTKQSFQDTKNQHKAALLLRKKNLASVSDIITEHEGEVINGITINKENAAKFAHFLGASTFKDWVNGTTITKLAKNGFVDGNGIHVIDYIKRTKLA